MNVQELNEMIVFSEKELLKGHNTSFNTTSHADVFFSEMSKKIFSRSHVVFLNKNSDVSAFDIADPFYSFINTDRTFEHSFQKSMDTCFFKIAMCRDLDQEYIPKNNISLSIVPSETVTDFQRYRQQRLNGCWNSVYHGNMIIGSVGLFFFEYNGMSIARLQDVEIESSQRGNGYSHALIAAVVESVRSSNCKWLCLCAESHNWVTSLYLKHGFIEVGKWTLSFNDHKVVSKK